MILFEPKKVDNINGLLCERNLKGKEKINEREFSCYPIISSKKKALVDWLDLYFS